LKSRLSRNDLSGLSLDNFKRHHHQLGEESSPPSTTAGKINQDDLLRCLKDRRSIFPKQYTGGKVSRGVLESALEAAKWAPSHHLTEPSRFVVFEGTEKDRLGTFLAEQYKTNAGVNFSQAKWDKKLHNVSVSSSIVAIIVSAPPPGRGRFIKEVCSVSMSVQNMQILLSSSRCGSYWSSASVYDPLADKTDNLTGTVMKSRTVENPIEVRRFLGLEEGEVCLGWLFVGEWKGEEGGKEWPKGRRGEGNVVWRT